MDRDMWEYSHCSLFTLFSKCHQELKKTQEMVRKQQVFSSRMLNVLLLNCSQHCPKCPAGLKEVRPWATHCSNLIIPNMTATEVSFFPNITNNKRCPPSFCLPLRILVKVWLIYSSGVKMRVGAHREVKQGHETSSYAFVTCLLFVYPHWRFEKVVLFMILLMRTTFTYFWQQLAK